MNKLYFLTVTSVIIFALNISFAGIAPTFDMTVRNIRCEPSATSDSILLFDVYLQQTNFGQPGVDEFEYCCGQFTWECDRGIQNGNLRFYLNTAPGANELPVSLRPPTFQVDSLTAPPGKLYLKGSGNLPQSGVNFFISPTFPGTRILTFRLRTSANSWPIVPFGLRFKLGPAPNTFVAYFLPFGSQDSENNPNQTAVALMDTVFNEYSIENGGWWICGFYPVELMSFTSNINRNNVTLNWTTATESNNQGFDIERSASGSAVWTKVGFVAGNGTLSEPKDYSFSDRTNTGHYNYRLRQIDFNGTINFHNLDGEVVVGLPTVYAISQNYPNPFNPTTKIDFELPYDSRVSIILYDISGREIAKIVNEQIAAGYHNVQFNGSNLSSGMYFYRINADGNGQNFISTKKMVMIK
jgi:hypothetical protein